MVANVESQNSKSLDMVLWFLAIALIGFGVSAHYYFSDKSLLLRVIGLLVVGGIALWVASKTKGGQIAIKYWNEATVEIKKVIWPSKQETVQTTIAVIAMVFVMAVILWSMDAILVRLVGKLIG